MDNNLEEMGEEVLQHILRYYHDISLKGLQRTTKNLSQNRWSSAMVQIRHFRNKIRRSTITSAYLVMDLNIQTHTTACHM
jgi:hypothetical protein